MTRSLAALFATLALSACADTTPLEYHAPPPKELPEASTGDGAAASECRQCVMGGESSCKDAWAVCAADTRCLPLVDCILKSGCFSAAQLQDRIACAQPCLKSVGFTTATDPLVNKLLPVNACTQDPNGCGPACIVP